MKHLTMEEGIDFANELVPAQPRIAIEEHLKNCRRCTNAVSQWRRVRQWAAVEPSYRPPQEAVRIAKAAFASLELALQRGPASSIEIVFDSFLQPPLEGFRSAGSRTRQILCRADLFQIDLQIELQPGDRRLVVTGQLLGTHDPQIVGRNIGIILSNLRGRVVRTLTNQFGEFRAEIENSGDLELAFYGTDHKPVVIPLRDALGQSSGEQQDPR